MPTDDAVTKLARVLARAHYPNGEWELLSSDWRDQEVDESRSIARAVLESGVVTLTQPLHDLAQKQHDRGAYGRDDTDYSMGNSDGWRDAANELRALITPPTPPQETK